MPQYRLASNLISRRRRPLLAVLLNKPLALDQFDK
jgi:hypothetical protein